MRRAAGIRDEASGKMVPPALAMARFVRFYGSDMMFGRQWSHPPYATSDGTIPWRLFWILYRARHPVSRQEMVEQSMSFTQGYQQAKMGKNSRVKANARKWAREAFPEERE